MSKLHPDFKLEMLGALTNCTVKHHKHRKSDSHGKLLTTENFVSCVLCEQLEDFERLLFVNLEEFFDRGFDYDFRDRKEDMECRRGGEPYTRPWGYYRFGLKVLNKYPDGNDWLGPNGWRTDSAPGEWPVSFHGTSIEGAKGITGSNYHAGGRARYGRGIYSTPNIKIAEGYSMQKTFQSEIHGKTYSVIMQNRINPENRNYTEEKDYWLIPVPKESTSEKEREIVQSSIRPYGILIEEYNTDQ